MSVKTKDEIYGVVQKAQSAKTDYTGLTTETASVSVNNTNKTISVDVNFQSALGTTGSTAYPGSEGAANRAAILQIRKNLQEEIDRATSKELELKHSIDHNMFELVSAHEVLQEAIDAEQLRAAQVEGKIIENLSELRDTTTSSIEDVLEKQESLSDSVKDALDEIIKTTSKDRDQLHSKIEYVETQLQTQIENNSDIFLGEVKKLTATDSQLANQIEETSKEFANNLSELDTNVARRFDTFEENVDYELSYLQSVLSKESQYLRSSMSDLQTATETRVAQVEEKQDLLKQETNQSLELLDASVHFLESSLEAVDENLQEQIHLTVQSIGAVDERLSVLQKSHDALSTDVEGVHTSIDTIDKTLASHNLEIDINTENIKQLQDTYATTDYVTEAITKYSAMSKQIVESVDLNTNTIVVDGEIKNPITGVIYLEPFEDNSGNYKQYTLIDNKLLFIGATAMNLEGYATEKFVLDNIPDVSSFIAEIPSEYVTESELSVALQNSGFAQKQEIINEITNLLNQIEFIDGGDSSTIST